MIKLAYGQKIEDKTGMTYTLEKYWRTDIDPMAHKIVIRSETDFYEIFHSSDLASLIGEGYYKIIG